jgi:hypothetical protein
MEHVLVWNGRVSDPAPAKQQAFAGVGPRCDEAAPAKGCKAEGSPPRLESSSKR